MMHQLYKHIVVTDCPTSVPPILLASRLGPRIHAEAIAYFLCIKLPYKTLPNYSVSQSIDQSFLAQLAQLLSLIIITVLLPAS